MHSPTTVECTIATIDKLDLQQHTVCVGAASGTYCNKEALRTIHVSHVGHVAKDMKAPEDNGKLTTLLPPPKLESCERMLHIMR